MNVLMVSQYFPPDVNGPSTRAYNAAVGLKLHGCKVTVISAFPHYPNGYQSNFLKSRILYEENIDGIRVIRTWVPNLAHWPFTKRILIHLGFALSSLSAIFVTRNVDIIISMNQSFFAFFPSLVYRFVFRRHIIRNVDDLWPEVFYDLDIIRSGIFRKLLDFIAGMSYHIPSAIIAVSQGYVQTLTSKYGVPMEKIRVIEHGVDTKRIVKHKSADTPSKRGKKTVMYSGNLNIGYDFELIFEAASLLKAEPVHFIIRGTGEYAEKLQKMVSEYRLENLNVMTDLLAQDELAYLLNTADIFLLPMSKSSKTADQGLPTKLLEYQAFGKPIVCISGGEAGSYIKRTNSGLVSDTRTANELAKLVMTLVDNESLANRLGTNGSDYIKNNLTLEMIGKQFMDVIEYYR